jgi:hypothetical protein
MIARGGSHVGRFTGDIDPKTGKYGFYAGNEFEPGETSRPSGLPGYPRRQWGGVGERFVDPNQFDFRAADRDAIAKAAGDREKAKREANMPARPMSTGGKIPEVPHLGDISIFQQQPQFNLNISNPAGANINRQVASMGVQSGNYQT